MIDYEKLKMAVSLAEKLYSSKLTVEVRLYDGEEYYSLFYFDNEPMYFNTYDIDELIAKLEELTQPEPKYKATQRVYYIDFDDTVSSFSISKSSFQDGTWCYENDESTPITWWDEKYLYHSKQALIEAQLQYWSKLYEEECPGKLVIWSKELVQGEMGTVAKCPNCGSIGEWGMKCKNQYCMQISVEIDKCQHEGAGSGSHFIDSSPPQLLGWKCIKCGEYYG